MAILPGYAYDVFISYRHNDNRSGWVTEFARDLQEELAATIKEPVSVYFDSNPHDGLLETHDVDHSLREKVKCLVFIQIVSQTYCDPKSFAWQQEFLPFLDFAKSDAYGLDIKLSNGNVAKRVLPVRIHEIDLADQKMLEDEIKGKLRPIDFIYHSSGVNRPLTPKDERELSDNKFYYRDQINKVANSVKEIIVGLKNAHALPDNAIEQENKNTPSGRIQFKAELNRRSVLRASLAYILLAALLWKLASIGIGFLGMTENILRFVTLFLIIFFPISILLSWLYERSPEGFIRTGTTAALSNPFNPDQKKPFTSNTLILLLAATTGALFLFFPSGRSVQDNVSSSIVDPSLAVVPFDNLSKDPNQEYISDGMMEAVLSHLNKIEGLRLTSRTTMMTYKGSKKTVPEIAEEVGVRFVLEGSIQRVDNTIRINAQLIDGLNDRHVWSEYYDRKMSDLLSIQSEVAQNIANKLEVKIRPETKANIENLPTKNAEAYDLYMKAFHLMYSDSMFNQQVLEQYRAYAEKAQLLDPQFSSPYSLLAWYWIVKGFSMQSHDVIQNTEPLLNKALSLNKDDLLAHNFLLYINLWHKWDFYAAERELNYAMQLEPSNPDIMNTDLKVSMGQFKEAVELARLRMKSEPNNIHRKIDVGFTLYFDGQAEESIMYLDSAVGTANPLSNAYSDLGRAYLYLGKYDRVVEVNQIALKAHQSQKARNQSILAIAYIHLGEREKANQLLNELKQQITIGPGTSPSFYTAMVYAQLGEIDVAFQYLEKSIAAHEIEMYWLKVEPPFKPLHNDPRWKKILDRVGFPE